MAKNNGDDIGRLHLRLENWARVYADRFKKQCSPGFRLWRSPDYFFDGDTPAVMDVLDADEVQAAWLTLSAQDRVALGVWWIHAKLPLHWMIREINRQGPLTVRPHNVTHYIRGAERHLQLALDMRKIVSYHPHHNLQTA